MRRTHRQLLRRNSTRHGFERLENRWCLAAAPTFSVQSDGFEEVDYYGTSRDWSLNSVNAPEVWAQGFHGEGIVVAVVDSGVDYTHSDLDDNIWLNAGEIADNGIDDDANGYVDDVFGWDFYDSDNDPMDESKHGTHVAGIISAEYGGGRATGIAYDARVMALRVLGGDDGTGDQGDIRRAIYYAVDNGADVINLSLGGGGQNRQMQQAIRYARSHDVLIVAAAGNEDGEDAGYPAAYSRTYANVVSVGAFNRNDELASFSNIVGDSRAVQVDAPGVSIFSTNSDERYASLSGTSMATPIVSALAALTLSASPDLEPDELRGFILAGADREIEGSDALGGINASLTVSLAHKAVSQQSVILPGDVDSNGAVEFADFLILASNFGNTNAARRDGDLNEDEVVTFADFLLLGESFATSGTVDVQTRANIA